jgi:hypothetical protein
MYDFKLGAQRVLVPNFIVTCDSFIEFASFMNDAPAINARGRFLEKYHMDTVVSLVSHCLS